MSDPTLPFAYLSDDRLAGLGLTPTEIADCIEDALREKSAGRVWSAPKTSLLPGDGRYMMATLAAADAPPVIAVKAVMVSPRNPARGLPGINGAIMILDSETGALRAVMDAGWVTAVRTAGLSAVMARRLAGPASAVAAFVGVGVQGRSHLDAFADLFPLTEIRAHGRTPANVEAFCEEARAKGLAARAATDPREALDGADLIVTSVTLNYEIEPFLDARWLKPGAFATITDLALPWRRAGMEAFGAIYVDDREQEAAMETPMVDPARIAGDMETLVTGGTPGGYDPARPAAFVFRGLAIGDLAVAALAYRRAVG